MRGFNKLYTVSRTGADWAFLPGFPARQHSWELQELV